MLNAGETKVAFCAWHIMFGFIVWYFSCATYFLSAAVKQLAVNADSEMIHTALLEVSECCEFQTGADWTA